LLSGAAKSSLRESVASNEPSLKANGMSQRPDPTAYQLDIVHFLKAEEPELWNWFASSLTRSGYGDSVRLDLLKTTYRIESATQPHLDSLANEAMKRYDCQVPVTFYQSQVGGGMNAALVYVPDEIHVVFTGPVLSVLSEVELKALLGHEFAHFLLYRDWNAEFLIAADLLRALGNEAGAASAHLESGRLFNLYTEVFADRGALFVSEDPLTAVSTLIKMTTGLTAVHADSYVRQAEEIFSKDRVPANQLTHPESYIRARALMLWAEKGEDAEAEIKRMIEGSLALDRLDLLGQKHVADQTRRLLDHLLSPRWFQSEATLAHARLFFDDFEAGDAGGDGGRLVADLRTEDDGLRDYFCYVLLDFAAVDRDMEDVPLAVALVMSRKLGIEERFAELANKELAIPKKQMARAQKDAEATVAKAEASSRT
jgi:hypothetical protein